MTILRSPKLYFYYSNHENDSFTIVIAITIIAIMMGIVMVSR